MTTTPSARTRAPKARKTPTARCTRRLPPDARKTEEDAANALDSIAAELGELMGESELNDTDTNDLIGEGEEL